MRFLIIKTSALGDIIHTFPVVGLLKQRFPEAQIDWVVEKPFAELLEAHPGIDRVYWIDTKNWRWGKNLSGLLAFRKLLRGTYYDTVFDLQGNVKSGLCTFFARARSKVGFGRECIPEWPNLLFTNRKINTPLGQNIRNDYLYVVQSFLHDAVPYEDQGVLLQISLEQQQLIERILGNPVIANTSMVMVCPGSAWQNKQMSHTALEKWLQIYQQERNCSFLFIWGNQEERKQAEKLQQAFEKYSIVVEKLPIPVLQNLMDRMDMVIAMDSLPLHLAGTTLVPTLSVFGASSSQKYRPLGERHKSYQGACPYGEEFVKRCRRLRTCKTGACIRSLEGKTVHAAFRHKENQS